MTLALAAVVAFAAAVPASPPPLVTERARILMGTLCSVAVTCPDSARGAAAAGAILDEIARLEPALTSWRADSELMQMNAAATDSEVRCSADLYGAIAAALEAARLTGGAFDPSIEPLNRVWDMRGRGRVPSAAELAGARALVGWRGVTCRPGTRGVRFAKHGMGLDLGGIGKGYALDRGWAAGGAGCDRALVNFGGEILAVGGPHPITLADPRDRMRPALALDVRDDAVSTSAQGERGVDVAGRHIGHILDPATGRPSPTLASVTVVLPLGSAAAPAARADALSTALLVMGRERAETFSREHRLAVIWLEPLGPGRDELRAWAWNIDGVHALPGVTVTFPVRSDHAEGS